MQWKVPKHHKKVIYHPIPPVEISILNKHSSWMSDVEKLLFFWLLVETENLLQKIAQNSSKIKKEKYHVIQKWNCGHLAKITDTVTWQDACILMYPVAWFTIAKI